MSEHLDPLTLPLWGSRLIEASAGTGKTWTIAALYLRLVLGHGEADADGTSTGYMRPLVPSEILVMTFTRAATRELSDRIRARLLQAARCFRGEAVVDDGDAFLRGLIDAYADGAPRQSAAWRLAMAAESMDDAAVHTIDAWCQRMLREHAFDSGCLFDEELTSNERAMLDEAAQDYWRRQLYPLSGELLDAALSVWGSVEVLAKDARALIGQTLPADAGQGALGALIDDTVAARHTELAALKLGWDQRAQAMQGWIDAQMARKPCAFDGRRMAPKNYTGWLKAL
ncbi:MAG: exodeoxyribonuclease V subunit beta, partial [Variovorax sp.]